MKKIIALLTMGLLALSCNKNISDKTVKDLIDNPTSETITAEIDGKSYTIAPKSFQEISLDNGKYELKTSTGEVVPFEKKWLPVVINPTKSTYVIHTEAYTETPIEQNTMYKLKFKEVEIEGKNFIAPVEVKSDFVISGDWKYSIDENFPETMDVADNGANYNLMISKIYRSADYVKEYADLIIK